jgi:RimJ/RimL family protein N-acetyltransferase
MKHCQSLQLHTDRLLLKDLSIDEAEAIFAYRSMPQVLEFQGWTPTQVSDAVKFIEQDICHVLDCPDTWFQFGIFLKEDGNEVKTLIGDLGVHFLPAASAADQKPGPFDTAEIGITISPDYQGKGYASEAVRCILNFLFKELNKKRVIASVDPANIKSMALMKQVGFQLDGIFPLLDLASVIINHIKVLQGTRVSAPKQRNVSKSRRSICFD